MDKTAIFEKMKEELNNISDEIKKLESKLDDLSEDAKVTYQKQITEMKDLYSKAEVKFEQAKDITGDKWEEVKDNVEVTRKALKNSYNYFLSHYKQK